MESHYNRRSSLVSWKQWALEDLLKCWCTAVLAIPWILSAGTSPAIEEALGMGPSGMISAMERRQA